LLTASLVKLLLLLLQVLLPQFTCCVSGSTFAVQLRKLSRAASSRHTVTQLYAGPVAQLPTA
jgi:hypothetical protein